MPQGITIHKGQYIWIVALAWMLFCLRAFLSGVEIRQAPRPVCPQNLVRAYKMLRPRAQMALDIFGLHVFRALIFIIVWCTPQDISIQQMLKYCRNFIFINECVVASGIKSFHRLLCNCFDIYIYGGGNGSWKTVFFFIYLKVNEIFFWIERKSAFWFK